MIYNNKILFERWIKFGVAFYIQKTINIKKFQINYVYWVFVFSLLIKMFIKDFRKEIEEIEPALSHSK